MKNVILTIEERIRLNCYSDGTIMRYAVVMGLSGYFLGIWEGC